MAGKLEINPLKNLYTDFMSIVDESVIKYKGKADTYETLDMKKKADAYLTALKEEDTFFTYYRYDIEVLAIVFNTSDNDQLRYYQLHRDEIPFKYRDDILRLQRKKIVDEYVENNNYYRMLAGLPDVEDDELSFVYPDDKYFRDLKITSAVPVHELTSTQISILNSYGHIDELIAKYPKKKYLNFLGSSSIDLYTSRSAKNFALLRLPQGISEVLSSRFSTVYEQCREYFMTCIYIPEYKTVIDYYDNFIALCIMIMTMYQIMSKSIKTAFERDFFDEYSVINLFETYNIPYNKNMDSNTIKLIVQNLNLLIQNKGSNKVIFDIASILGYDRIKIYKYYVMRSAIINDKGIPVTAYKDAAKTVLDYERMFRVYFQKVALDEVDMYSALTDSSQSVSYQEIIEDDPYWIDDAAVREELYATEYNYMESKYMGISIIYRLSKILFENVYLLKMILEKKDELPHVQISIPRIVQYNDVPLFDCIVLLCALTCKQNHLKGEILFDETKILHILGFNFSKDFETIKAEIKANPYLDDALLKYFEDESCYNIRRINEMFNNYKNLKDTLVEMMSTTNDINVYEACKKLYNSIYYTNENREMFNLGTEANPVYASTFSEYIRKKQPEIFEFINELASDQLYIYINHIISKVLSVIPDMSTLGFFSEGVSTVSDMLVELIRFFKSYTVDMLGLNVLIIFDLKPENLMRLIDYAKIHKTLIPRDELLLSYGDIIKYTANITEDEYLKLFDKIYSLSAIITLFDNEKFFDKIHHIHKELGTNDKISIEDTINTIYKELVVSSKIAVEDIISVYGEIHLRDNEITFDDFVKIVANIYASEHDFGFMDSMSIYAHCDLVIDKFLSEEYRITSSNNFEDRYKFIDHLKAFVASYKDKDNLSIRDKSMIDNKVDDLRDAMALVSVCSTIEIIEKFDDKVKFIDKLAYTIKDMKVNEKSYLTDSTEVISGVKISENLGFRDKCKIIRKTNN